MTPHDLEIWCAVNRYTQTSLAKALGMSKDTISKYKRIGHFPVWFPIALKGLEVMK